MDSEIFKFMVYLMREHFGLFCIAEFFSIILLCMACDFIVDIRDRVMYH